MWECTMCGVCVMPMLASFFVLERADMTPRPIRKSTPGVSRASMTAPAETSRETHSGSESGFIVSDERGVHPRRFLRCSEGAAPCASKMRIFSLCHAPGDRQ